MKLFFGSSLRKCLAWSTVSSYSGGCMKFDSNFKSSLFFGVCSNVFISPLWFLMMNPEETAVFDYLTE